MSVSFSNYSFEAHGPHCRGLDFMEPERMERELAGRWLYFLGDSSTRGLFLTAFYALHRRVVSAPGARYDPGLWLG